MLWNSEHQTKITLVKLSLRLQFIICVLLKLLNLEVSFVPFFLELFLYQKQGLVDFAHVFLLAFCSVLLLLFDHLVQFCIRSTFTVHAQVVLLLTLLMLGIALATLFLQILVQLCDLLGFFSERLLSFVAQIVYVGLELVFGLFKLKLKLMLEGKQSIISSFGLVGDKLFGGLDFSCHNKRDTFRCLGIWHRAVFSILPCSFS